MIGLRSMHFANVDCVIFRGLFTACNNAIINYLKKKTFESPRPGGINFSRRFPRINSDVIYRSETGEKRGYSCPGRIGRETTPVGQPRDERAEPVVRRGAFCHFVNQSGELKALPASRRAVKRSNARCRSFNNTPPRDGIRERICGRRLGKTFRRIVFKPIFFFSFLLHDNEIFALRASTKRTHSISALKHARSGRKFEFPISLI